MGEMAPEKPPVEFPPNAWGVDLLFSDGGFGLGTFFRKSINTKFTGFVDTSFSIWMFWKTMEYLIARFVEEYIFKGTHKIAGFAPI